MPYRGALVGFVIVSRGLDESGVIRKLGYAVSRGPYFDAFNFIYRGQPEVRADVSDVRVNPFKLQRSLRANGIITRLPTVEKLNPAVQNLANHP